MANGRLIVTTHDVFANIVKQLKSEPHMPIKTRLEKSIGKENYEKFERLSIINEKNSIEGVTDTLVVDPDFAALLNAENAIQVENTVYRITPYGTFVYLIDKEVEANEKISNYYEDVEVDETEKSKYLYEIEEGIFRYDTFGEMQDNTNEYNVENYVVAPLNSSPNEQDVEVHTIVNNHTIVGQWWQGLFGFTASYTRNFSSSNRVKVAFSSPNFILFTYITISIKMQKKNWIGWSGTNASELILGWDGITYNFNNPIPIPLNANPYQTWQPNPLWTAYEMYPPKSNKTYIGFNLANFQLNLTSKEVAKGYKAAFNYLKGLLSPQVPTENLAIIYNPNETTFSREDFVALNQNEIVKTLDWATCIFRFSWNMSGSVGANNFTVVPSSFTIKNASIFGMAKYGDKWLGIRIEKL
jgi:hypothetical protein